MSNGALLAGERIFFRHPRARDREGFLERVGASRKLHGRWAAPPSDPEAFTAFLRSAYLGYYAFGPLGLHRLETNIQPGNESSIALVKGAGFRLEGYSRPYLKIAGRWRDHERWAILAEDRPRRAARSGRTT